MNGRTGTGIDRLLRVTKDWGLRGNMIGRSLNRYDTKKKLEKQKEAEVVRQRITCLYPVSRNNFG